MKTVAPTAADIENLAMQAFDALPDLLRAEVGEIVFRVEEYPDQEIIRSRELQSRLELLGLYQGIDLLDKSVSDPLPDVDMIFLYQRPLLDYWSETGETMECRVRHVLIHEIGHHFGSSDDDMKALEAGAEALGE